MNLEVVLEVRLAQKHSVAVLVRATELLRVFVCVCVSTQLLLRSKRLVTSLWSRNNSRYEINLKLLYWHNICIQHTPSPCQFTPNVSTRAKH